MATSLGNCRVKASIVGTLTKAADLTNAPSTMTLNVDKSVTDGTGTDKANQMYVDTITLGVGLTETLDLNALVDTFGDTIVATKLKALLIKSKATVSGDKLEVGGNAGGNAIVGLFADLTDKAYCGPGGIVQVYHGIDGVVITAGTADELEIKNVGGNSIDFDISMLFEV